MKLTSFQKRHVAALLYLHNRSPSIGRILAFRPVNWVPFILIAILSCVVFQFWDKSVGLFFMGLTVGAITRIFAHARFLKMAWPVNEAVIDWSKVEALSQEANS